MIEININKVKKNYGFKNILNEISFEIKTGERVALIGENGSGKSTLLNLISGKEFADDGTIAIRKDSTIGYLTQTFEVKESDIRVKDVIYESFKNILDIENKLREYELKISNSKGEELDAYLKKYGNLQEIYLNIGGYELNEKIGRIVTGLKITNLLEKKFNSLSGGEKTIVSLASIMVKNPSILLLDEPTNHLDIKSLEWFEEYLKNYNGTVLIVSHDRFFLDKVTTKTILIERGKEVIFNGNYSYYVKENEIKIENEFKEYKDQQKLISGLKKKIKQLEEFGKLAYPGGESFFKRAESIKKRLEKIEVKDKPIQKKDLPLSLNFNARSGNDVLLIDNYDLKIESGILINNINVKISYRDKTCILGNNGSGKSTLIRKILENINSDLNQKIKIGSNVKIGYIPQEIIYDKNITVLDYARKCFIGEESLLRSALSKYYFNGNNVFKKTINLSGGEKVRLKLFELMQQDNNFLIFDEPTNHIDIETKELLEEALINYKGTVLFVSHDRYFINKIATKILYIDNNHISEYIGNYDDLKNILNKEKIKFSMTDLDNDKYL